MKTRKESDSFGALEIPFEAYYGVQTQRALNNFPISGLRPKKAYCDATVHIKRAAAVVNKKLRLLDDNIADALVKASDEALAGGLAEWFVVDVYQAGAGTSHNMNVNEVLANRALEILGKPKGDYGAIHPNDHVNMSQSTNDVCPTAIRIGALLETQRLLPVLDSLERALRQKGVEFDEIVKSGRTHLMDAVPMRLGQEFGAYAANLHRHRESIAGAADLCLELGIGGMAVGTGLNADPRYRSMMLEQLQKQLGVKFRPAGDYFEAMQSLRPLTGLSGTLRNLAQDMIRITNDLRLLGSGPTTGLSEISLPPVQPGSSIMPGKVNPSMAEMVAMVCFQVIGCDTAILLSAQAGQLELNVMMPVVAWNLLHAIEITTSSLDAFTRLCVSGITANAGRCQTYAENSVSIVTVLNPHIGYKEAADIAKESLKTGKPIRQLVKERGLLTDAQIKNVFNLRGMTEPGIHRG